MADRIEIRELLVRTIIGIDEHERRDRQDVVIGVTLDVDTKKAGRSDRLRDVPNYRTLAEKIVERVEGAQFRLVERLASEVARICLEEDARIERVEVRVEKPRALTFARTIAVTIVRARGETF